MDQRKAFLFFGFTVLVWMIFWTGAIRAIALKHPDHPAARGVLVAV